MFNRRAVLSAAALSPLLPFTHAVEAQEPDSPLFAMLSTLPSLETVADDATDLAFGWCDISGMMASIDENGWPENIDEFTDLIQVTQTIALDTSLFTNAARDLDALLGFDLSEIERGVFAFQAPGNARVWDGQFDPDRIASAFKLQDYVNTRHGDHLVLASPTGDDLALESELALIGVGEFNYLIVNEQRIITTARKEMLGLLLQQHAGVDSLIDSFGDSPVPGLVASSTSALVQNGAFLKAESLGAHATGPAEPLPAARWFAGTVTLAPDSKESAFLIEFPQADANAAADVIADRIANGTSLISSRPLSEVLGEVDVQVRPGSGVVAVQGRSEEFARNWSRMIYAQDLGFLATE